MTASTVVGIDGKKVDHETLGMRSRNAREALAGLLAKIDAGEIRADAWLFLFDKQNSKDKTLVATESLDSGLTLAQVVHLLESYKFDLLLTARNLAP